MIVEIKPYVRDGVFLIKICLIKICHSFVNMILELFKSVVDIIFKKIILK
jgi:hypothetical protein